MADLLSEVQDLLGGLSIAIGGQQAPLAIGGMISPGSYNPADGTAKVLFGSEMVNEADDSTPDAPKLVPPVESPPYPIATQSLGAQFGPTGGERCFVLPVDGGGIIFLVHYDDSPGVDAGEHLIRHPAHIKSKLHLKNDGSTTLGAETQVQVVAPQVYLGERSSNGNDGVVRLEDLQNATNAIISAVQTAFNTFARTVQPGSGAPAPNVQSVTAQASDVSFSA